MVGLESVRYKHARELRAGGHNQTVIVDITFHQRSRAKLEKLSDTDTTRYLAVDNQVWYLDRAQNPVRPQRWSVLRLHLPLSRYPPRSRK